MRPTLFNWGSLPFLTRTAGAFLWLLTLPATNAVATASSTNWTSISNGLTGLPQGARSVAFDASGTTLYAVGVAQAFKSTDGGSSWRMLGGISGATILVPDPAAPSTVYAGTGHGVWKSTDSGENWTFAGLRAASISALVIDPLTPSTLYAGTSGSDEIYRTTDGGANWSGVSVGFSGAAYFGFAGVGGMLIDPATPSTLYVISAGPGSALYKSTDGAQTWNVIANNGIFRLLAITPTTIYVIIGGQMGLSTSTDGGATWTSTGFPGDVVSMVFDPADSNIAYGSVSAPQGTAPSLYWSHDAGHAWSELNTDMPFVGALLFDRANPSVIFGAGYSGGMFRSNDAGKTWRAINSGFSTTNIQVLMGDPSDPSILYAGGDGGLFKTIDSGGNWKLAATFQAAGTPPSNLPVPVTGFPSPAAAGVYSMLIDRTNPSRLYVGTARVDGCFFADVLLYTSEDAGSTWSDSINPNQSGCSGDVLLAMDPSDPNTFYIEFGDAYDGYGIRKTTDGGASWNYTGFYADVLYTMAVNPNSPSTLYAGTDNGVMQSIDGGATWNALGLAGMNVNLLASDPDNPDVLYATVNTAYPATLGILGIFKSTDGGANWLPINRGLGDILANNAPVNALLVDPTDTSVLYLATGGYGVFRSIDAGGGWTPNNNGLTTLDVRALAVTGGFEGALYAGTPSGIFRMVGEPPARQTGRRDHGR